MNRFVNVKNVFRKDIKKHYIKQFTEDHLLVLVYMQRFTVHNRNRIDFCMGWLFDDLGIEKSNVKKDLNNALCDLVDWGLIKLYKDIGDRNNINRNTRIQSYAVKYNEQFTQIHDSEIDKILNSDVDFRQKKTMLFLYCDIASRIDDKGYCFPSYESFKADLNTTSDNRIDNALVALKEYGLIDYDNVGQIKIDNRITQGNNVYVLCVDQDHKEKLHTGLQNRRREYEEGKARIHKGKHSNKRRSIKQKLNHLWKKYNNNSLTDEQLKTLKELEMEYYQYIQNDKDTLDEIEFVLFNPAKQQEKEKANKQDKTVLVGRRRKSFAEHDKVMAGFTLAENSDDNNPLACFERVRQQNINPTAEDILGHDYASKEGQELKESLLAYMAMANKRYIVNNMDEVKSKAKRLKEIYMQEISNTNYLTG